MNTTIRPDRMDVDFRAIQRVSEPGHPVFTRRSYSIVDGDRTLHQTADNPVASRTMLERGVTPEEQSSDTIRRETERP